MSITRWAAASLAVLALAQPAEAGSIPLFNTGVDAGGVPLAGGSDDPHWSIIAGPGITNPVPAVVLTSQFYVQSPDSVWVWRNASGQAGLDPFTFRLTFDLTGFDPTTAVITGSWGVDNTGEILLNGQSGASIGTGELSLPDVTGNNFYYFHDFTLNSGFVAGINTLDFVVDDAGSVGGLSVTNLVGAAASTAAPEPTSLVMLGVGAIGLMGYIRRCRKASRA